MVKADRQRILHIKTYCEDIAGFVERFGNDFDIFVSDRAYYNCVSMCVLQIGELTNSLSEEFREETETRIPWKMIREMRNWLAHAYGEIDESILWETVTSEIPVLHRFCEEMLQMNSG